MERLLFEIKIKPKMKAATREQVLATDIYEYFGRRLPFGRIMGWLTPTSAHWIGFQCVYEVFQEVKKADCDSKIALFQWKIKHSRPEIG